MGALYRQIPLLGVLAVVYLILASVFDTMLGKSVFSVTLPSTSIWTLDVNNLFVLIGLALLYLEILKSTRTGRSGCSC